MTDEGLATRARLAVALALAAAAGGCGAPAPAALGTIPAGADGWREPALLTRTVGVQYDADYCPRTAALAFVHDLEGSPDISVVRPGRGPFEPAEASMSTNDQAEDISADHHCNQNRSSRQHGVHRLPSSAIHWATASSPNRRRNRRSTQRSSHAGR